VYINDTIHADNHIPKAIDEASDIPFDDIILLPLPLASTPEQNPAPIAPPQYKVHVTDSLIDEIWVPSMFIQVLEDVDWWDIDSTIAHQLQHPAEEVPSLEDPDHRFCLEIYLSTQNASQATYIKVVKSYQRWMEKLGHKPYILSFYWVEKLVKDLTGVEEIYTDMCEDSCVAFDGPYAHLNFCPFPGCGKSQYLPNGNQQKCCITIPIRPQLQARWQNVNSIQSLLYRHRCKEKLVAKLTGSGGRKVTPYCDLFDGSDYWDVVVEGHIQDNDMVLAMSFDGAQLYHNKASDAWIWIWILMDYDITDCYKKKSILVGGMILGPKKPKFLESFLFKGL
jgi:hypothetical protein